MIIIATTMPLSWYFSYATNVNGDFKHVNVFFSFRGIHAYLYLLMDISTPKFSQNNLGKYLLSLRKLAY